MGVMLSVLLSYVGAIELVFIVRDVTHQLALHQMRLKNEQRKPSDITVLQDKIKASINALETVESESVEQMQDGVLYQNGYRIDNEQSIEAVAKEWDERRKVLCISEPSVSECPPKSIISNGSTQNSIQSKRTNDSLNDNEPNEQNNYRPIVRDDHSGRRKAFKKRHSSSSQSSDSIRLSREEELKMFTELEEEECNNSSFTPINYSNESSANSRRTTFQEKQNDPWGNIKPSNFHDSELWKRERAMSIEEEVQENSSTKKYISSDKHKTGVRGTADKPTRETSCENDKCASELNACKLVEHVDNYANSTLKQNDEVVAVELIDPINVADQIIIDKPYDVEKDVATISRDVRSSTVYSRSESENSNFYQKSTSRDSSSTCNESNMEFHDPRQRYNRTDSTNSFIQDELDSEEYHHNHRFSMTAETLEYIRGRDDWKLHTENKLNGLYTRQSSNISIQDEIDSDEYHHDRLLSELIEMAYSESDIQSLPSLPSSFEDNKVFDRYYLELQKIEGQLSSDIDQNIAQKQVVLLNSSETQSTDAYLYPLPDIILDQIDDQGGQSYKIERLKSDYSNAVSESEDDIQSVIEVTHDSKYDGEIIATLDMSSDIDEMIEVTLWDLKDDLPRELSSKESSESSVEIIDIRNENLIENEQSVDVNLLTLDKASDGKDIVDANEVTLTNETTNDTTTGIHNLPENVELVTEKETFKSNKHVNHTTENVTGTDDMFKSVKLLRGCVTTNNDFAKTSAIQTFMPQDIKTGDDATNKDVNDTTNNLRLTSDMPGKMLNNTNHSESLFQTETDDDSLHTLNRNVVNSSSTGIEFNKSFIEHEKVPSVAITDTATIETSTNCNNSKIAKKVSAYENVDDLVQEGCMGVWFHN